ncbi:MAG: hypothetical protein JHC93_05060 [Parachlamydiales bacterium]|nr:hypothetical protein [Parachlamydiales bacterium]
MILHPTEVITFAISASPTPVLNVSDHRLIFGSTTGKHLQLDHRGFIAELEFVALPGTKFEILESQDSIVWKVKTSEYPSDNLFVDSRFLKKADKDTPERLKKLPSPKALLKKIYSRKGAPYVWGGNWFDGIPQMLYFYPPRGDLDTHTANLWQIKGLDCSGLLYEASDGYLPRNTSHLKSVGKPVPVEGLTAEEICVLLRPLDLIVFKGHVVMVYDQDTTIESRVGKGVYQDKLLHRLKEIMEAHEPANHLEDQRSPKFVARRWHPEV